MQDILNIWELFLLVNKPVYITKIKMYVEYKELGETETKGLFSLLGSMEVYLETQDSYTYVTWVADAEGYENEEERKNAMLLLESHLEEILREDLDAGEADTFWEEMDLENRIWKKKEG